MSTVEAINNLGPYAHNPRGNLWFKDDSTYGRKLLMKMGWKHGKGLGKNENGIKENLSVKFRNTNSGLGFKDDPYANIMKTEYETILKDLSEKYAENKGQSIENESNEQDKSFSKKSKVVKSKVRYPKLFFGKDVNKYSEKDMKSIFICSLPSNDTEKCSEDSAVFPNKTTIESEVPEATETYSSSLSIAEYFAKKMQQKKSDNPRDNGDLNHQEPFSGPKGSQELLSSNKLSKKRKKKSDINFIPESKSDSSLQQQQPELETEIVESEDLASLSNKKSSSKIKCSLKDVSIVETKSQSGDKAEDVVRSSKKKKHKRSQSDVFENDKNLCPLNSKHKKLKVCENGLSSADNVMHDTLEDKISCQIELSASAALELNNRSNKKCKKKKKISLIEINAESGCQEIDKSVKNSPTLRFQPPLEMIENGVSNANIACTKRKKKKSKKLKLKKLKSCLKSKRGSYSLKNVSFNDSVFFKIIDTDFEDSYCLEDVSSLDGKDSAFEVVDNDISGVISCASEDLQCDEELTEMIDEYEASERESDIETENNGSTGDQEVLSKSEDGHCLSGLPSSKSLFNNPCVEDQKQEMKVGICNKKSLKSLNGNDKLHCDEEFTEIVDKYEVSEGESDMQTENNTSTEVQEVLSKSEDGCSISDLPSAKSPYNNSWVEDQKQALKMKMYKKMLKSLKKHEVLGTSNLTSIKGYGNWGFK